MKKMKKMTSIALALVLCLALAVPAFAAGNPDNALSVPNPNPSVNVPNDMYITIGNGDTLANITLNWYGSVAAQHLLYNANGVQFANTNGNLIPGMTLVLPYQLGNFQRLPAQYVIDGERYYVIQEGDTLASISTAAYGHAGRVMDIFERNKERLTSVGNLYVGMRIVLPARVSGQYHIMGINESLWLVAASYFGPSNANTYVWRLVYDNINVVNERLEVVPGTTIYICALPPYIGW